ncbi:MAG: DMP19 family protein [Chloroflexota bacterium]|nr:DMP19 family protein [Chloroflexota bacterium]
MSIKREISIIDSIYERIDADGVDALTTAELYYFAIWWLEGEVNNGTLHQFFSNSAGEFAHEALRGLGAVGAVQMAQILEQGIALFPDSHVPKDQAERDAVLDHFTPEQLEQLAALSGQFIEYPDELATLVDAYVQTHDAHFLGPRTLMERWEARHARGADTRPRTVNTEKREQQLADDARISTRSCPVCGQPCPDWRVECRRCGYPLGRANN